MRSEPCLSNSNEDEERAVHCEGTAIRERAICLEGTTVEERATR